MWLQRGWETPGWFSPGWWGAEGLGRTHARAFVQDDGVPWSYTVQAGVEISNDDEEVLLLLFHFLAQS